MKKISSFEIKYNNGGEVTSEFEYSKFSAVSRYMGLITAKDFNISELKILKNGKDITEQVNKFLFN